MKCRVKWVFPCGGGGRGRWRDHRQKVPKMAAIASGAYPLPTYPLAGSLLAAYPLPTYPNRGDATLPYPPAVPNPGARKALRPRPPPEPETEKARRLALWRTQRLADSPAASAAHMPVPGVAAMEVDEEAVPSFARLTTLMLHPDRLHLLHESERAPRAGHVVRGGEDVHGQDGRGRWREWAADPQWQGR